MRETFWLLGSEEDTFLMVPRRSPDSELITSLPIQVNGLRPEKTKTLGEACLLNHVTSLALHLRVL